MVAEISLDADSIETESFKADSLEAGTLCSDSLWAGATTACGSASVSGGADASPVASLSGGAIGSVGCASITGSSATSISAASISAASDAGGEVCDGINAATLSSDGVAGSIGAIGAAGGVSACVASDCFASTRIESVRGVRAGIAGIAIARWRVCSCIGACGESIAMKRGNEACCVVIVAGLNAAGDVIAGAISTSRDRVASSQGGATTGSTTDSMTGSTVGSAIGSTTVSMAGSTTGSTIASATGAVGCDRMNSSCVNRRASMIAWHSSQTTCV